MKKIWHSQKRKAMLKVTVQTASPEKIRLRVYDAKRDKTYYTDRYHVVKGKANFYVRMPTSPMISIVEVFNEKNGDMSEGKDPSFKVTAMESMPLPTKLETLEALHPTVYSFIKFAQSFAEKAGTLSTKDENGKDRAVYISPDRKFQIHYVDIIKNDQGKALRTPARISQTRGIIEISAYHFRQYTVPRRLAILFHEYCHFYENENPKDEVEADLNALLIYLGLGYPRIEAHEAFLAVFKNSPSELNMRRYKILSAFIDKFDDFNFTLQQPKQEASAA